MQGNTIFFLQDYQSVARTLPRQSCSIVTFGRIRPDGRCSYLRVRRQKLLQCLRYLKEHNPYYSDIEIDDNIISSYPEDGFISDVPHFDAEEEGQGYDRTMPSNVHDTNLQERFRSMLHRRGVIPFPAQASDPTNEYTTPGLLTMAFPALFPNGEAQYMRDTRWPISKMSFPQYAHHLLSHSEPRFRKHLVFKFFCYNFMRRNTTMLNINFGVKKQVLTNLSPEQIKRQLSDPAFQKKLHMFTTSIPGTPGYWNTQRSRLLSMLQDRGMPAFFLTLSSNDKYWKPLRTLYNLNDDDSLADAVKDDPFPTVCYFRAKLDAFLKRVVYEKMGVTDHYFKVEFQGRGSIHVHILLWHPCTNEIFVNNTFNRERAIYWADQFVSACSSQPPNDSITTDELTKGPEDINDVIEHATNILPLIMRHTQCGPHCQRRGKCRFNYPKPLVENTTVTVENNGQRAMHYKRNDQLVLPHHKFFLGSWGANMDLQLIVSVKKLAVYLLSYVLKTERMTLSQDKIASIITSTRNPTAETLIKKTLLQANTRDVSAQEAAYVLLFNTLVGCSRTFVYVNTDNHGKIYIFFCFWFYTFICVSQRNYFQIIHCLLLTSKNTKSVVKSASNSRCINSTSYFRGLDVK